MSVTSEPNAEAPEAPNRKSGRVWLLRGARIAVSAAALVYVARLVSFEALRGALARVSLWPFLAAFLITLSNTFIATVRWQTLLRAYGAERVPSLTWLWREYLIGTFYSTYLPGGVGGDIVRGVASRTAFGEKGATASLAVVLVDRVLGLSGLLVIACAAFILFPLASVKGVFLWTTIGLSGAVVAVLSIASAKRLARWLPASLAARARALPELRSPGAFGMGLVLSLVTQSLVALTGHVLIAPLAAAHLSQSFVIVPLANAAMYLPITIAGAGAREAAFIALYRGASVSDADAMTASLCILSCHMLVAAFGGLLQFGARSAWARESAAPHPSSQQAGALRG
ncbi:MAG: lysylphosphatidylglycerol synthase transmembrane domain-containing protein [Polyangiaceae bacterium]